MKRFFICTVATLMLLQQHALNGQVAASSGYYPSGGGDSTENVSIVQLIANPKEFDHKRVQIIGYLRLEFEGDVIYLQEDDHRFAITKNGLWVDLPKEITPKQIAAVNNKYVICDGLFIAGEHGHMGSSSGTIKEISRLQIWVDPADPRLPKRQ